jgi:hypothetical protein
MAGLALDGLCEFKHRLLPGDIAWREDEEGDLHPFCAECAFRAAQPHFGPKRGKNIRRTPDNHWVSGLSSYQYGPHTGTTGRVSVTRHLLYERLRGTLPTGTYVVHGCDDNGCLNPEHMRLYTPDGFAEHCRIKATLERRKQPRPVYTSEIVRRVFDPHGEKGEICLWPGCVTPRVRRSHRGVWCACRVHTKRLGQYMWTIRRSRRKAQGEFGLEVY